MVPPVHDESQSTSVALPKAISMPEVPKRALAAPSSMQRSKFTLAPGSLLVIFLVESEHGGEEGRVGYGQRTCEVGVCERCLTALYF